MQLVPSVYLRLDFLASEMGGGCGRRVPMYRPVLMASSLACDSSTIGSMISKPVFTLLHTYTAQINDDLKAYFFKSAYLELPLSVKL